nr:M15 family metallopeptidase [Promicromonospora panici]
MLRCDAAERLTTLSDEFERVFGYPSPITDSYRTYAQQVILAGTKPHLAAIPGTSNHGWGLAVDLGHPIAGDSSAEYAWLREQGPDYGWDSPSWGRLGGMKPEPSDSPPSRIRPSPSPSRRRATRHRSRRRPRPRPHHHRRLPLRSPARGPRLPRPQHRRSRRRAQFRHRSRASRRLPLLRRPRPRRRPRMVTARRRRRRRPHPGHRCPARLITGQGCRC